MPVRRVRGGYQWGTHGKVYRRRADAERQGRAIKAAQRRRALEEIARRHRDRA